MTELERIEPEIFREVLGNLPTGVTVVTATSPDGPVGMACNSVASVSLEPPLISLCPAKSSTTWPSIHAAGSFCINVMASHHEDATRSFARRGIDRFGDLEVHTRVGGPALSDAVAWIDCRIRDQHDAGDHLIIVADVLSLEASPNSDPLVFFRGRYGGFEAFSG
jgi:3-hydroxy-9,10-secoandrosta-1,3,5(10)-triene-9,17-dione monooxygenase reductase component